LVHADETRVQVKGLHGDGYVWVFANPETVVYVYAPNRDGDTARKTLDGFKGVLVSDFYAAYDSLDCPPQKCLVHLVRDFNDDLLKNPFDEELKQMASRFGCLLQAIIETVDRYGLKKYHLNKHKKDVDRFYAQQTGAACGSEVARHYQHRLVKNRGKLFTFLDHDGVPWNNNTAENAVKRFASRRKLAGTPFTEGGIRDYLVLLSIRQTLRYRNLSFWKFLLSGETSIEAFASRRRRCGGWEAATRRSWCSTTTARSASSAGGAMSRRCGRTTSVCCGAWGRRRSGPTPARASSPSPSWSTPSAHAARASGRCGRHTTATTPSRPWPSATSGSTSSARRRCPTAR
jgi:hypothetical protein